MKDIWPSHKLVLDYQTAISTEMFRQRYAEVYDQNSEWKRLSAPTGIEYNWDENSTYIQQPPYFTDYQSKVNQVHELEDITGARPLLILGDYVTTDHISPAGAISPKSVAGKYLLSNGVSEAEINSYGSRRGNHLVMIRGSFANPRIKNLIMGKGVEGPQTQHVPDAEVMSIYDASMKYQEAKVPLVVIAGKGCGCGSSRGWAALAQKLLGG